MRFSLCYLLLFTSCLKLAISTLSHDKIGSLFKNVIILFYFGTLNLCDYFAHSLMNTNIFISQAKFAFYFLKIFTIWQFCFMLCNSTLFDNSGI